MFRDGEWFLDFDGNEQWDGCTTDLCLIFGAAGYTPVTGDWDKSRAATKGVFQDDIWQLDSSGSGQFGYFLREVLLIVFCSPAIGDSAWTPYPFSVIKQV